MFFLFTWLLKCSSGASCSFDLKDISFKKRRKRGGKKNPQQKTQKLNAYIHSKWTLIFGKIHSHFPIKVEKRPYFGGVNFSKFLMPFADPTTDQNSSIFQEACYRSEGAIFSVYEEQQMEQDFQHTLSYCDVLVIAVSKQAQWSCLPVAAEPWW